MTTPKQKSIRFGARRNPKKYEHEYNPKAVDEAIAASNRAGKRIGGKERKLIHALLKGRKPTPVAKNPRRKKRKTVRRAKRSVRVIGARKNPVGQFVISAKAGRRTWFFRQSTGSFIDGLNDATTYRSHGLATRTAKALLRQLPKSVEGLSVKRL